MKKSDLQMMIRVAEASSKIERDPEFLAVKSIKIASMIFKDVLVKRLLPRLEDIIDKEDNNKTLVISASSCMMQMLMISCQDPDLDETRELLSSKIIDCSGLFKQ